MILTPTSNFPRWDRPTKRKLTAMMILFSPTLLNGVTLLDPFKSLNLLDQRLLQTGNIFFNLLFPEALSIEIATQTNKYAWKHANKNWYPTNPEEIKALIAQYWYSNCHGCSTTPCPRHVLVQR
jgi:hypothetical protein